MARMYFSSSLRLVSVSDRTFGAILLLLLIESIHLDERPPEILRQS